jgi:hypothetical protein
MNAGTPRVRIVAADRANAGRVIAAGRRLMAAGVLALAGGEGRAAVAVGAWQASHQGIEWAIGTADAAEPRRQQVRAVRVDLRAPGIEFVTTPGNGEAPLETMSETTTEFARRHRMQAAINANYFSPCCAPGAKDLGGLAISAGVVVSPPVREGPSDCVLAITRQNQAVIRKSDATFREADYWTAVAGSGIILQAGRKPAREAPAGPAAAHPRTAVGVSQDGRYLILLVVDGRQPGYSEGATLEELADWLLRFGAHDGLNLDGGGSTTLVREEAGQIVVVNRPSGTARRPPGGDDQPARRRGQRSNGNHLGVRAAPLPVR